MQTVDLKELQEYSERLRGYSQDELEDIYYNIHILKHPLKYRLLMREMERRNLQPGRTSPVPQPPNLRRWLERRPFLARHPRLIAPVLSLLLFLLACGLTFGLLSPIWLFAVPLKFLGIQTAIVYFACAPVPPILAAGIARRVGGRGVYGIWVLLGVAAGMLAFNATGAPSVILRCLAEPQGAGGGGLMGF